MEEKGIALKKIARGVGIVIIGTLISKVLAYVYRIIIARIDIAQYGLFSIALAVFSMLFTFSSLGLNEGVVRFVAYYKGLNDERRIKGTITSALKISLPISLIAGFLLFIFSDWVAITFFHNTELSILFKIVALILPIDITRNIFISSIRAFQKVEYDIYSKSITENVAKVVLTSIAVYLGFGVIGATVSYLIAIAISCILSFYFLEKKVFSILKTNIVSISSKKSLLIYSLPLLFTGLTYLIIQWTDTLMLGYFRTVIEVGVYNVALPTAFLLFVVPSSMRILFIPVMSEIYAQRKKNIFNSVYQTVTKWIIIIESIIFILLVVFSQQIIRILFGESYVKETVTIFGNTLAVSVLALIILASGMIIGEFTITSKDILMVFKRTKLIFFYTLIAAVLNVILNYSLIPKYGLIGAAIATAAAYTAIDGLIAIQTYFITKVNPFRGGSIKVIITALLILLLMIFFKFYLITNLVYLITSAIMVSIAYLILLVLLKVFDEEDIIVLRSIQGKISNKIKS